MRGISVILDRAPSCFRKDEHGLIDFDGEYADKSLREHKSRGTRVFDFGKGEVKSILLSSAACRLRECRVDGLRVDAAVPVLCRDYGRQAGQWTKNIRGGRENPEAAAFLRALNAMAFAIDPNALMAAKKSTA